MREFIGVLALVVCLVTSVLAFSLALGAHDLWEAAEPCVALVVVAVVGAGIARDMDRRDPDVG